MTRRAALPLLLALAGTLTAGCVEMAAVGVATGAAVLHDRRTTDTVLADETIEFKAWSALNEDPQLSQQGHVNINSYNRLVLLTGEVPDAAARARFEEKVRAIAGVNQVHNALTVGPASGVQARANDSLVSANVRARMLGVPGGFDPTRVSITTEAGVVYLMGLVTEEEAQVATEVTRTSKGVQRVVRLFEYVSTP